MQMDLVIFSQKFGADCRESDSFMWEGKWNW